MGETRRFRCDLHGPLSTINGCSIVLGNASQQDQREDDNYKPLHSSSFLSEPAPFSAELPGPTVFPDSPLLAQGIEALERQQRGQVDNASSPDSGGL